MSKEKKVVAAEVAPVQATPVEAQPAAPVTEKLSDTDRLSLDLAKAKRQTVLAEAKTALANNENAELQYRYLVLQLYMKYGLTAADAISEAGDIIRGGALQGATQPAPQGQ
jgi:hypothetical protein